LKAPEGLAVQGLVEAVNHGRGVGLRHGRMISSIIGMTTKRKVSITIDADLLGRIDKEATSSSTSRSTVIESWLRASSRSHLQAQLDADTLAYYQGLSRSERAEDAEWAAFSSREFSRMEVNEPPARLRRSAKRRR